MRTFYLAKVRGQRVADDGREMYVTDQYLVDALSFAEAEAKVVEEASAFMKDLAVRAITLTKYSEVIFDKYGMASQVDGMARKLLGQDKHASEVPDTWFKCKLNFIQIDEKTGKERKLPQLYLVHANSVGAAHELVDVFMKGSVNDYKIEQLDETPILDVLLYEQKTEEPGDGDAQE